jgi:probable HAF family extracellular repeat protein
LERSETASNPGAALDINDHGQVVGWSYDSSGRRYAFLWEDGRLSDLNVLSGVGTKSFRLGSADAINNAGQIIGHSATYKGPYVYDYGTYLLTPKP